MDTQFQTSFIPKKPLAEDRVSAPRSVSIFVFIGTVIFIASIVGAGVVYFMKAGLEKSIVDMKKQLEDNAQAFEPKFITELQTADRRINSARGILTNHIVVSPIFEALQELTLKSVQFTKFGYTVEGSGAGAKIRVAMSGKAQSYTSIALQSDKLTENKYIYDPVFSNLTLDEQSNVLFDLSFAVDPHFVSFGESLTRTAAAASTTSPSGQTTTPVTPPTGGAAVQP